MQNFIYNNPAATAGCGCGCNTVPFNYPPCSCCCRGPRGLPGKSAYQIAVDHGYVGTESEWLESLKCKPEPYKSCYLEALGASQLVGSSHGIVFDRESLDVAGDCISLNQSGTVFVINRTGLYHVEWSVNLSETSGGAVIGTLENSAPASGASSATGGNFASGALINVETVPYTLSLFNYGDAIELVNPAAWQDTAASIRILRFADGAAV